MYYVENDEESPKLYYLDTWMFTITMRKSEFNKKNSFITLKNTHAI